jgi:chromosome segregation ATPase
MSKIETVRSLNGSKQKLSGIQQVTDLQVQLTMLLKLQQQQLKQLDAQQTQLQDQQAILNEISSLEQQLNALLQQHEQQQTLLNELLGLQKQQQEQQVILQQQFDLQEQQHSQRQQSYVELSDRCEHLRVTVEQLFSDCEQLSSNASDEARQAFRAVQEHRQQTDQAFRLVADGLIELQGSVNGLVERLPR